MLDNVRITDIPPSNWMFTLFPAANEHGANYELVQDLLLSLYHKLEKQKAIETQIENSLSINELELSGDYCIQDLLDEELVTRTEDTLVLTQKTIEIIMKAAEIQNNDYTIGFYPHHC